MMDVPHTTYPTLTYVGKTWSMQGGASEETQGIIPRMARHLFDRINADKAERPSMLFMVTASYFELYNEVIFVSLVAIITSRIIYYFTY